MVRRFLPPPEHINDLMTVKEIAAWLGLARNTVRGWILRGELEPAYDVGTPLMPRYRVPRHVVLERMKVVEPLRLHLR